ncbi:MULTISPECIES: Nif3-like dinuclear metal center hexameric protein [Aerococcus]|uniref:GTP cyclohydrolase 1 type 2 homolog n=2 Tax=Aerococcus TaxID=1375 RepID=A0A178HEB2_9LACT|nr:MULTISPECIES: Nif3-like dinuclear metal center hexameric protein [Aerococcus]MCY3026255.1 Nif3-like dinuclear metal center hexameric protein [Aerococcus loyolae]MCY3027570.1 Nif3-like dinuclear metal center hexameric protein [Aerococcus loyolae]MCY3029441.1 Nif3-like dinuclear metal center hexameric protein [Aerococcus loyolae]MDK6728838.1 Nif3-like dinuclear metal center hexameric protein [Aerococcus urinae]MDK7909245.1 Nif3-like dinuclear metal center hexameric protein [Aerococcus urinae]
MTNKVTVSDLVQYFEKRFPTTYALEGDPIGLHFGSLGQEVKRVLVTLDVRPEVVEEAIEKQVDFIFSHHPVIFRPAKRLSEDDPQRAMYAKLIRHQIAVYSAHTNLDSSQPGMNDWLAKRYGIENAEVFAAHYHEKNYRLVTFLPQENLPDFKEALSDYPLSVIGNYQHCFFQWTGQGNFIPVEGAQPRIGEVNQVTELEEVALSFTVKEREKEQVCDLVKKYHPYEEPVIEVYEKENDYQSIGMGRIGELKEKIPFKDYVEKIKDLSKLEGIRFVTRDNKAIVHRVAVLGGAGSSYYQAAKAAGADVFITADADYHTAHDIYESGLCLIDPGHHMEAICIPYVLEELTQWSQANHLELAVFPSEVNTDPFHFL